MLNVFFSVQSAAGSTLAVLHVAACYKWRRFIHCIDSRWGGGKSDKFAIPIAVFNL